MELKYFGKVSDLEEEFYEETISLDGNKIHLCLGLDDGLPEKEWFANCASFLENLAEYDRQILEYLKNEPQTQPDESGVDFYVSHHADEFSEEELLKILGSIKNDVSVEEQLLNVIHLDGMSIYEGSVFWDYTIDAHLTDYLISVETDFEGNVLGISIES